jgi:hypothetical protein
MHVVAARPESLWSPLVTVVSIPRDMGLGIQPGDPQLPPACRMLGPVKRSRASGGIHHGSAHHFPFMVQYAVSGKMRINDDSANGRLSLPLI